MNMKTSADKLPNGILLLRFNIKDDFSWPSAHDSEQLPNAELEAEEQKRYILEEKVAPGWG